MSRGSARASEAVAGAACNRNLPGCYFSQSAVEPTFVCVPRPLPSLATILVLLGTAPAGAAQEPAQVGARTIYTVTCSSKGTERNQCAADTSKGVILARSTGDAPCLLGKTWGYDASGVWVSEGCSAVFIVGPDTPQQAAAPEKKKPLSYVPNAGFLIVEGEKGEVYVRLFSYARYLNQKGLDESYTDAFGNTKTVPLREDFQLNKFFLPFSGWFLTPKMRYYLYV